MSVLPEREGCKKGTQPHVTMYHVSSAVSPSIRSLPVQEFLSIETSVRSMAFHKEFAQEDFSFGSKKGMQYVCFHGYGIFLITFGTAS